jgi:hypothetical protein
MFACYLLCVLLVWAVCGLKYFCCCWRCWLSAGARTRAWYAVVVVVVVVVGGGSFCGVFSFFVVRTVKTV